MNKTGTRDYLRFALDVARAAGDTIRIGIQTPITEWRKADGSPVTSVDQQINSYVKAAVAETYPDHAVLGEESDRYVQHAEFSWICDPLDGTKSFVLGIPNSLFMLALQRNERLVLAVAYDPFTSRMYHAVHGGGSFCNGDRMSVNQDSIRDGYVLLGTESYPFVEAILKAGARTEPVSGTGYRAMMVAGGRAAGTMARKADFHDIAPSCLIVEEAGGRVTALDGSRLQFDQSIDGVIISNGVIHDALVSIANDVALSDVDT